MSHLVCILAAGRGSRMAPVTDHIPKPLLPFGGVPLLARSLIHAANTSPAAIYVNAHHKASELKEFQSRYPHIPDFELVIEDQLLGTAGGVRRMVAEATARGVRFESVLVVNADILTTAPLTDLLRALHADASIDASLLTLSAASAEGNIKLARADASPTIYPWVVELPGRGTERFSAPDHLKSHHAEGDSAFAASFGGISALRRERIEEFPSGAAGCLVRDLLGPALSTGGTLSAVSSSPPAFWSDLGTPARWVNAVQALRQRPDWLAELPGQHHPDAHTPSFEERAEVPEALELHDPAQGQRLRFSPLR